MSGRLGGRGLTKFEGPRWSDGANVVEQVSAGFLALLSDPSMGCNVDVAANG